jgi:hypothetical protein
MDFSNFVWREIKTYMMDDRWSINKEVDMMLQDKPTDELSNILYTFGICVKLGQFDQARQIIDEDVTRLFDNMVEEIHGLRQWECPSDREGWIDEEDQARYDELQEKIKWFDNFPKLYLMVSYKEQGFDWVTTGEPRKWVQRKVTQN